MDKTHQLLHQLAETPLPRVLATPVASQNSYVESFLKSIDFGYGEGVKTYRGIKAVATLIQKYPEAGIPWYSLAGITKVWESKLALKFIELSTAYEARALGAGVFKPGAMTGRYEYRDFLTCLYNQGVYALDNGDLQKARRAFEQILLLNEWDNDGARCLLPAIYLVQQDRAALDALKLKYPDDDSQTLQLAYLSFAIEGNNVAAACDAVNEIASWNKYILLSLAGSVDVGRVPDYGYTVGSESEAATVLYHMQPAAKQIARVIDTLQAVFPAGSLDNPVGTFPCYACGTEGAGESVPPIWKRLTAAIRSAYKSRVA